MANQKHLRVLSQGTDVWNSWRHENPDVKPDLRNVNLNGITLYNADLDGANLSMTDLHNADMHGAKLMGAILKDVDLVGANLSEAYLSGAKLHKADLRDANLARADLSGADLSEASLIRTNFSHAHLSGASFCEADLSLTDFKVAYLPGANLTRSYLNGTDFTQAFLGSADFSNAISIHSIYADIDLSTAIGLETIKHGGPSILDVETLLKTGAPLPEVFLRGCGVPEILITYLPSLVGRAIQFYSCFISYSHSDKVFARRVHDTLQGHGIRCWLDEKQMNPGDDIYTEVDRGIRLWDKVLLCCSKSSLTEKWWVDQEIDKAFQKERDLMKERGSEVRSLIPLDVDGFLFSDEYTNPKASIIKRRVAADFKGWEHDNAIFEREIERVIKALRTDSGKEPPPVSKL